LDADGDAAIAHLTGDRSWLPFVFGTFAIPGTARDSRLGELLVKSGRTTGQTEGRVDGEGTYFINYDVRPGVQRRIGIRGFKLVAKEPNNPGDVEISSGGDSGSLWYHESSGDAIGLHFAGEISADPRHEHAIACNLSRVLERLNVRLATAEDLLKTSRASGVPAVSIDAVNAD